MRGTVTGKILEQHLVSGRLAAGEEIALRIDQTLLQDATGTMACMEFEALGVDRVRVDLAVQYVDHNMLQFDHRNADDPLFLQGCAARYGLVYSRAGNGICHQVHTERFARPGATLLGADSHTPTSGACGALAIGAGGLEVALAMAGHPFQTPTPTVVGVHLENRLPPWVASKDLILWLIRRYTVKGGLGRIFEFTGPGVASLPVTQRATVCNMITELGGTTAIFPSDEQVHVDLAALEPLIARPSQPDNVVPVEQVAGTPVYQVCFGSSVNSWYEDLAIPAAVMRGRHLPPATVGTISPGSRQILTTITTSGVLEDLERAGLRILEPACGPCVGIGQAPPTGKASVRTFNRNFKGRSGTFDDLVYLASPATTAATALAGEVSGRVLIVLPDNVSTGSMAPDGAIVMADRSNVEAIAGYTFLKEDPEFVRRARDWGGGFIVAGENYGQGSSREHAALAPLALGVRVVLAEGFARIHRRNLIAQGLLPLAIDGDARERLEVGDRLEVGGLRAAVGGGAREGEGRGEGKDGFRARLDLSPREREVALAGGVLNQLRNHNGDGDGRRR